MRLEGKNCKQEREKKEWVGENGAGWGKGGGVGGGGGVCICEGSVLVIAHTRCG